MIRWKFQSFDRTAKIGGQRKFNYTLEHIFSYTAKLPPERIGPVPEGIKANFYVTGGKVEGPKINGKALPVGGDWLTFRSDGVGVLDVRATIETHDGALIYTTYSGMMDLGKDGYQKVLQRDVPAIIPIQSAPRYYTAHPQYQWINRIQCVGIGQARMGSLEVSFDIYAIRSGDA